MENRIDVPPIVSLEGQFKERIFTGQFFQVELGNNAESVGKFQPRLCFETLRSKVAQEILRD